MSADTARPAVPGEPRSEGKATALRLLRIILVTLVVAVITFYVVDIAPDPGGGGDRRDPSRWEFQLITGWPYVLLFAFVLAAGVIAVDMMTPHKRLSTISGVFLGLIAGVVAAAAVGLIIDALAVIYEVQGNPVISTIKVLVGIALCYLAVSIVLQTQDDFRLIIPYVEFAKQIRGVKPLIQDTSALIDGRVLEMAESGLVQAPIIIPRFVIGELQALSDSSDRLKRARGRRGLDMVTRLQRSPLLDVTIDETPTPGKSVDQMLVDLARRTPGVIVTNDLGLKRVAAIHGVAVINMNDVANSLKPLVIPGEALSLRLIKRGEQPGQGVGYLDDGTMVVAEDGAHAVGEDVTLTVTSSMQTSAGRLIFGRVGVSPPMDRATPEGPAADSSAARSPHSDPTGDLSGQTAAAAHATEDLGGEPEDGLKASGPIGPKKFDRKRAAVRNPRRG